MGNTQATKEHRYEDIAIPDNDSETAVDVENISITSGSDDSEMESFTEYLPKIEQLLEEIGLQNFSIEFIQHGYSYQNCVYALKACNRDDEQYILHVPVCPEMDETDSKCESTLNNVSLLGYLADKMPVPRVEAFSANKENSLNAPFEVQTKLPGQSLDRLYSDMSYIEKSMIVDELVNMMKKFEHITFTEAGTFTISPDLPDSSNTSITGAIPSISTYDEGDEEFIQKPSCWQDRRGSDVKTLLTSHLNGWIAEELKGDEVHRAFIVPPFRRSLDPVILYHWDLEPRNIMVEKDGDSWKICGIIDWDDACAVPRTLARKPPAWIWDFNPEMFTGYLDNDFHPKEDLSPENLALKAHIDAKAAASLPGYLEDAYRRGRWSRRIWTLVRTKIYSQWYLDLMDQLLKEWDERSASTPRRSESPSGLWKKSLDWLSTHIQGLRNHESLYIIAILYCLLFYNFAAMHKFIPLLALLAPLAHAASNQGSASLYPTYECDPSAALNLTLNVDTCSIPGPTIHSYIIGPRPTCANGTAAAFAFYHANDCHAEGFGSALNAIDYESDGIDGLCLGLMEFNSVAFICDGVRAESGGSSSVASSVSSASATPVTPSATMTSPLYPITTASPITPPYPSGTGASVGLPSGTLGSSPAAFTGAAVRMGASLIAVVAAGFGATLSL